MFTAPPTMYALTQIVKEIPPQLAFVVTDRVKQLDRAVDSAIIEQKHKALDLASAGVTLNDEIEAGGVSLPTSRAFFRSVQAVGEAAIEAERRNVVLLGAIVDEIDAKIDEGVTEVTTTTDTKKPTLALVAD